MHSDGKKCELQSYILDVKMAILCQVCRLEDLEVKK